MVVTMWGGSYLIFCETVQSSNSGSHFIWITHAATTKHCNGVLRGSSSEGGAWKISGCGTEVTITTEPEIIPTSDYYDLKGNKIAFHVSDFQQFLTLQTVSKLVFNIIT